MPFMFVYNPVLLLEGNPLEILQCLITALAGAYLLGSGFEGYFWNWKLKAFERPLLLAGALLLIVPGLNPPCWGHTRQLRRRHRRPWPPEA